MSYIYASRRDKTGNDLTTSYGNKTQAKKFGGESASFWEGLRYFDTTTGKFTDDDGDIVRSRMKSNSGGRSNSGKFSLYSIVDGSAVDTGLRFATYGAANTTMKALIGTYPELLVLESAFGGGYTDEDDDDMSGKAPF